MNPTSGVISEAWGHYKSQWQHLIGIAFVVYLVIALISAALVGLLGLVGALLAAGIGLTGVFLLQGALVKAVEDIRDGRADLSMADTLSAVREKIPPIAGASILAGIGIAVGLVLLIVPGLFLLTIWVLIVPTIVLENRRAMEAFGRSRELVRGNGWNVFGIILLTWLVLFGVGLVIELILAAFGDEVRAFLGDLVSGTVTAPFIALVYTLLYYRLRESAVPPPSPGTAQPSPGPPPPPS
ncbi:MAG: hypothetical protein ACRDKB_10440 [Actinomycetota bacterium]